MKKSKKRQLMAITNFHFILILKKIRFKNAPLIATLSPDQQYRLELYRDIQKMDMSERDFQFSGLEQYSFNESLIYFSTCKKWNSTIILSLYSISIKQQQHQETQQILIGDMTIDTEEAINQIKENDKQKFLRTGTICNFDIEYLLYISDSKNGVNRILQGERIRKSREKSKLKKIKTIDRPQNRKLLRMNVGKNASEKICKVVSFQSEKSGIISEIPFVSSFSTTTQRIKKSLPPYQYDRIKSMENKMGSAHHKQQQQEKIIEIINQGDTTFLKPYTNSSNNNSSIIYQHQQQKSHSSIINNSQSYAHGNNEPQEKQSNSKNKLKKPGNTIVNSLLDNYYRLPDITDPESKQTYDNNKDFMDSSQQNHKNIMSSNVVEVTTTTAITNTKKVNKYGYYFIFFVVSIMFVTYIIMTTTTTTKPKQNVNNMNTLKKPKKVVKKTSSSLKTGSKRKKEVRNFNSNNRSF